jgi:hypothetical protein
MKEIGRYQREHMALGIEPYTLGFIGKVLGWSEAECRVPYVHPLFLRLRQEA